jgi:hypothetical protein
LYHTNKGFGLAKKSLEVQHIHQGQQPTTEEGVGYKYPTHEKTSR